MKKTTYTVTRFEYDNEFYIEVTLYNDVVEFVLCNKHYGIKKLMFGLSKEDCLEEVWEELISNNIESYIDEFVWEYCND